MYNIKVEYECGDDISIAIIFDIGIPAKRRQIEQNVVLRGIGKSWAGILLVLIQSPNTSVIPKIGDLKTPPSNYGQTAADGTTLWSDRRCEVIVVANAPKTIKRIRIMFAW